MKTAYTRVLVLLSVLLSALPAIAETRVYVLAGQSNMAGWGAVAADLPSPYNVPQPDVKFWTDSGWTSLQGGFGYIPSYFGPEVSFGRAMADAFPKDNIYLVKYAVGGTTLGADWNSNGSGPLYNTLKSEVAAAVGNLNAAGKSPVVEGMLWMQGESDAMTPSYAADYGTNLTNLITQARSDFDAPNMDFVVGRILSGWGDATLNATVRAAQETVPGQVGHASWINTDDLQYAPFDDLAFGGHFGTQGQIGLGLRFADALSVPEPSMLILAITSLIGLLAFAWWGRRTCGT